MVSMKQKLTFETHLGKTSAVDDGEEIEEYLRARTGEKAVREGKSGRETVGGALTREWGPLR
jgi:hypothetical protein